VGSGGGESGEEAEEDLGVERQGGGDGDEKGAECGK
jgi:hypothetical protein